MIIDWLSREVIFAICGVIVSIIRYGSYIYNTIWGATRPHAFSWFNWGLIVALGAVAQFQMNGGLSAWLLVLVSAVCFLFTILGLIYGEKNYTKGDWATFIGALIAIAIWQVTQNPMLTILLLITIDCLSYYPTWRKMWVNPWSEPTDGFFWAGSRYFFALLAVPEFTIDLMMYPFWLMAVDWATGVYMIARRRHIRTIQEDKI